MKNIKFLILFIAIALISCERDDICAETTSTTPRLIIEFYDADETDELKNVPRLTVYGENLITNENGEIIEPTEASDKIIEEYDNEDSYVFNSNTNKIALPLIIDEVPEGETITTRFVIEKDTNLRLDTDNSETSNKEILEIKYNSEFIYVSRACGYKSNFSLSTVTRETGLGSEPWINNIEIVESIIENENTTHVRIFH